MAAPEDKKLLVEALIREASDVDLICYLARTEGAGAVRDLLECIADAHVLSEEDVFFNMQVVLQKKKEAAAHPSAAALRRLTAAEPRGLERRAPDVVNGTGAVH